ncbi:MAG: NFACT family protein [Candidatus Caldarchaeum sp.]
MVQLSSAEIAVLVKEIGPIVRQSFVKNVYGVCSNSLALKLSKPGFGTFELCLAAGSAFYSTDKTLPKPEKPSDQIAQLRKLITGLKITELVQKGSERIVEIRFEKSNFSLVVELMPPGNIILLKDGLVVWALEFYEKASRTVKRGVEYRPPAEKFSALPGALPKNFFSMLNPGSPIVASLSRDLGLGGKYAQEVLFRAGVDKQAKTASLTDEEWQKISDALSAVLTEVESPKPAVYYVGDEAVPSVIELESLADAKHVITNTFSEAVMTAHLHNMAEQERKLISKQINEKIKNLEKEKNDRLYVVQTLLEKMKVLENFIEKIRSASHLLEDVWTDPEKKAAAIAEATGCKAILKHNLLQLEMGEAKLTLRKDESLHRQLGKLFDAMKALRKTVAKLQNEVEQLETRIKQAEGEKEALAASVTVRKPETRKLRKPFREFRTSGGFTVMLGRDASSNVLLLRKHLSDDDLVLHADIQGSPATILKNGAKASPEDIEEAAQMTACYSRAWREMFTNVSVYYVSPSQVSFKPPSGQYLPKGSFMVYGRKTYVTAELRLAAVSLGDGGPAVVPYLTARRLNLSHVELRPGRTNAGEAAGKVLELLKIPTGEENVKALEAQIPYGMCSVFYQDKLIKS